MVGVKGQVFLLMQNRHLLLFVSAVIVSILCATDIDNIELFWFFFGTIRLCSCLLHKDKIVPVLIYANS